MERRELKLGSVVYYPFIGFAKVLGFMAGGFLILLFKAPKGYPRGGTVSGIHRDEVF